MQDPNIENTEPIRPDHSNEETVPITVHHTGEPVSPNIEQTQPGPTAARPNQSVNGDAVPNLEQTQPILAAEPPPGRPRRWPWVILGIFLILALGAIGTMLGYREAERIRVQNKLDQVAAVATEHFMAGLVAQQNKQYELARTQYEYVIKLDSSFPGVQDKLREVMIASAIKNTPTPVPTKVVPTLTPTLDTRPQQDIYTQVRQEYANQNWEAFFATVDSLRRIDPTYQAVQVDGMMYFAFRFRGIDKIIHQANLEGGLYDLALAERFAPLDVDALGYRNWARMYLNGASFWEIDWEKVIVYFEEIYPYFPNMRDSSGLTAIERYRIAARGQGDKLYASGDYCGALDYYQKSLQAVADGALEQTATAVYSQCYPPTDIPTITPTPSPTIEVPVATTEAPPEPTVESTVQPTDQSGNP
jgi:hypothetical protein